MSLSDFRHIANRGRAGRKERLFRAAVTAFCSLTRASRSDAARLDDLALPLYEEVSVETRRFVAAALSEVAQAPAGLVRRLASEGPDIAAPLLLRSKALADVDLIALIGRHGLGHARVIGKRAGLNPTIASLVRALLRSGETNPARAEQETPMDASLTANDLPVRREPGEAAEEVRSRLRAMMRPSVSDDMPDWVAAELKPGPRPGIYERLKGTALTGSPELFHTALADALGIDLGQARALCGRSAMGDLMAALKYLEFNEEQAFLIVAATHPADFAHPEAIRLLLGRYHLIHREMAADMVRGWKEARLAAALGARQGSRQSLERAPANNAGRPAEPHDPVRKAS